MLGCYGIKCCIKSPEQGARRASFIKFILSKQLKNFDDFAGGNSDEQFLKICQSLSKLKMNKIIILSVSILFLGSTVLIPSNISNSDGGGNHFLMVKLLMN